MFATHSPFILSDIPASNILRIEEGEPSNEVFEQTFGANIHNLLENDFFLRNGFMGEFAKEKINDVIKFISSKKSLESHKTDIIKLQNELDGLDDSMSSKGKTIQTKTKFLNEEIKELSKIAYQDLKDEKFQVIKIIGEPILRSKLTEMMCEVFPDIDISSDYEMELNELKRKYNKHD